MAKTPKNKSKFDPDFDSNIYPTRKNIEAEAKIGAFAKAQHDQQTPERKLKGNMLAIKYRIEDYVDNAKINVKDLISLEDFLSIYLNALSISFAKFAKHIDTTPARLKKCISGERKFNAELALKFAAFFHTRPDLWLQLDLKNDTILLESQKARAGKYKKYDYQKVLSFAN